MENEAARDFNVLIMITLLNVGFHVRTPVVSFLSLILIDILVFLP